MFYRLLFDHWIVLFPLVAFVTAASVFGTITYRALRMPRGQIDRFSHLPFNDDPSRCHEDADAE